MTITTKHFFARNGMFSQSGSHIILSSSCSIYIIYIYIFNYYTFFFMSDIHLDTACFFTLKISPKTIFFDFFVSNDTKDGRKDIKNYFF